MRRPSTDEATAIGQAPDRFVCRASGQKPFPEPRRRRLAACRYFNPYLGEDDPGRKDLLIDIATEES